MGCHGFPVAIFGVRDLPTCLLALKLHHHSSPLSFAWLLSFYALLASFSAWIDGWMGGCSNDLDMYGLPKPNPNSRSEVPNVGLQLVFPRSAISLLDSGQSQQRTNPEPTTSRTKQLGEIPHSPHPPHPVSLNGRCSGILLPGQAQQALPVSSWHCLYHHAKC
jgi:hypothetical protein